MVLLHAPNLVEYRIFFDTPKPPRYPKVLPLGHGPGGQMKILSDMFYIFHLWEDIKLGLNIFEIDFVIEI